MKYNGSNKDGFERDVALLNDWIGSDNPSDADIDREVRELADAFDIDHVSIWDYLPEYI